MYGYKSEITRAEILAAFHTDESVKHFVKRVHMSLNTLRPIWQETFGVEACKARGKTLQAKATLEASKKPKTYRTVVTKCSECGIEVSTSSLYSSKHYSNTFVCAECKSHYGDRACAVCGMRINGEKGMNTHLGHSEDPEHLAYRDALEKTREDARWENLVEGVDFVRCLLCGQRMKRLVSHLINIHGIATDVYKEKFPGAPIQCKKTSEAHHRENYGKGETKFVTCPECQTVWEGSKFLVPGTHDLRCPGCLDRAEVIRKEKEAAHWVGRHEPDDYVECRLCGWKGSVVIGHVLGVHPDVSMSAYRKQFPMAPLTASGAMYYPTRKLEFVTEDFEPFKDSAGKVQVALAAQTLGCSWPVVLRCCRQFSLPTRNRLAFQKQVLDVLAGLLEDSYKWEWRDSRITNPRTGYQLFFDGFFPKHNLLVEVQGKQHVVFIPYWHKSQEMFKQMQERDALKARKALQLGFKFFTVMWDDSLDPDNLKRCLMDLGVLQPG